MPLFPQWDFKLSIPYGWPGFRCFLLMPPDSLNFPLCSPRSSKNGWIICALFERCSFTLRRPVAVLAFYSWHRKQPFDVVNVNHKVSVGLLLMQHSNACHKLRIKSSVLSITYYTSHQECQGEQIRKHRRSFLFDEQNKQWCKTKLWTHWLALRLDKEFIMANDYILIHFQHIWVILLLFVGTVEVW